MNESAIFVVGVIIFAITIYGAVMAGGLALARVAAEEGAMAKDDSIRRDPEAPSDLRST